MRIVDLFYEQARQHRAVRGFRYGKDSAKGGTGDLYPQVWVDDPIYIQSVGQGGIRYTVNFDVLGVPDREREVLDEIKTEVAKFVKKGYSADVKALLAHFDAPRVSMLKPEQFAEFRAAVDRYARGESMERIINDLLA